MLRRNKTPVPVRTQSPMFFLAVYKEYIMQEPKYQAYFLFFSFFSRKSLCAFFSLFCEGRALVLERRIVSFLERIMPGRQLPNNVIIVGFYPHRLSLFRKEMIHVPPPGCGLYAFLGFWGYIFTL